MILGLVNLLVVFAIVYFLYRKAQYKPLRNYFPPAIAFKFLMGIAVGIIYKYYYGGGDTFNFFHDAVLFSDFAYKSPSYYLFLLFEKDVPENLQGFFLYANQPRALITSKILSIFTLITGNNYWISGLYFSLFSFSGMWYLANIIAVKYPKTKHAAVIGFLFFPSVIFWSSGILKESLIMGALTYLFGFLLENITKLKKDLWWKLLWSVVFLMLVWQLKYYYLAVFIAISCTTIVTLLLYYHTSFNKLKSYNIIIWMILFVVFLSGTTFLYPTLQLENFLFYLLDTHDTIYKNSLSENLIHYDGLNADFRSFIKNLPKAFFAGLFRPGICDINSFLHVIPAFENLFILFSAILILKNLKKPISSIDKILVFSIITYILILAILMAFAAPNFGTMLRYKVGFLPFLIYLVCINNPILHYVQKLLKK